MGMSHEQLQRHLAEFHERAAKRKTRQKARAAKRMRKSQTIYWRKWYRRRKRRDRLEVKALLQVIKDSMVVWEHEEF
jgi:hypothetical protein